MLNSAFSSWPSFSQEEADAISRVLLSNKVNYWTGQEGKEFEKEFASFSDCEYAVAVANGTLALDLALKALDIGEGDEVVVTPRTFLASVSSVVMAGATPVFADVDLNSQNIEANTIEAVLTPSTKAVVVVHLAGMPAEMDSIMALSEKYGFAVIEDCAQAHGAKYKGCSVGSIGHIGCWSFCQDKIMTTGGEGGMVTTNDRELWSKMWAFKDHGKSWDAVYQREHPPGFRWLHESFGTNLRMTEIQAAIGRIQLRRMNEWHQKRLRNVQLVWNAARNIKKLRVSEMLPDIEHAAYKCYVFVEGAEKDRDEIMRRINEAGVPCFSGSCSEVYLEAAFDGTEWRPEERLPGAKRLGETSLMFLCHPTLTQEEIDKTCSVLKKVVAEHFP